MSADRPEMLNAARSIGARHELPRSALFASGRSLATKFAMMPLTIIASLVSTRLLVDGTGVDGYATCALILSLPSLLPASDLGIGAAITNVMARSRADRGVPVAKELASAIQLLGLVAVTLILAALGISLLGYWPLLLGGAASRGASGAATAGLCAFAATLPLTLGYRVLLGLGENHRVVFIQGLGPVVGVILVAAARFLNGGIIDFVLAMSLGPAVAALAAAHMSLARAGCQAKDVVPKVFKQRVSIQALKRTALPMLIVSLALPIAYQTDRLILSHVSDAHTLAVYSAAQQTFTPALALLGAAGQPLWPMFITRRSAGFKTRGKELTLLAAAFGAVGTTLGIGLIVAGPWVTSWMTRGGAVAGIGVMSSFAFLLTVHACYLPLGMYLMDERGLRIQAWLSVGMAICNLPLSVMLANAMGASGPVVASGCAIAACMGAPAAVLIRRLGPERGFIRKGVASDGKSE